MGRKNTAATAATAAPAATPAAAPAAAPAATPAATPAAAPAATPAAAPAAAPAATPAATPAAAPAATPAAAPAATPAAEAAAEKSSALARMHVIWPHGLNLRDGPGVDFAVIGVLPCGFNVETDPDLAQEVGDDVWVPVQAGWVNRAFLSPAETEP